MDKTIVHDFLLYALMLQKEEESFDRSFRASLTNMKTFTVKIPIQSDGTFDIKMQKEIADRFVLAQQKKNKLHQIKSQLGKLLEGFLGTAI